MALEVRVFQDGDPVLRSTDDENGAVLVPTRSGQRALCLMALSQAMLLLAETHVAESEIEEIRLGAHDGEVIARRGKLRLVGTGETEEGDSE